MENGEKKITKKLFQKKYAEEFIRSHWLEYHFEVLLTVIIFIRNLNQRFVSFLTFKHQLTIEKWAEILPLRKKREKLRCKKFNAIEHYKHLKQT